MTDRMIPAMVLLVVGGGAVALAICLTTNCEKNPVADAILTIGASLILVSGVIIGTTVPSPDRDGIVTLRGKKYRCVEVTERKVYEPVAPEKEVAP